MNDKVNDLENILLNTRLILSFPLRLLCFLGVLLLLALGKTEATEVPCNYTSLKWTWLGQEQGKTLRTCEPDIKVVDDEDFTISYPIIFPDSAFKIDSKKGVQFLPTNLFDVLPKLVRVQVVNCSVKSINANHFKDLSQLRALSLNNNKIEQIANDAFVDLISLELLDLSSNKIQSLGKNTFDALTSLGYLHLSHNEIQLLHSEIFKSLVKVEEIKLDQNEIFRLDANVFENLPSFKRIFLDDNKLDEITRNLFRKISNLEQISFRNNRIEFINADAFNNFPRLIFVDLRRNLCIGKLYLLQFENSLKKDLEENCNVNYVHEKFADIEKMLNDESQTIKAQQKEINAMQQIFLYAIGAIVICVICIFCVVVSLMFALSPSKALRRWSEINPFAGNQN